MRKFALGLHLFCGISAFAGGMAPLMDPQSPLGMSTDALVNGPFEDFFIPGLFLFAVIGCGNLVAAAIGWKDNLRLSLTSLAFGLIMMSFLGIEIYVLGATVFLHILYLTVGLLQVLVGGALFYRKVIQQS